MIRPHHQTPQPLNAVAMAAQKQTPTENGCGTVGTAMTLAHSFAPLARADARRLILGSMPGQASLAAGQYYAHPRNAFWPLLQAVLQAEATANYAQRCAIAMDAGIAIWDVLKSCERPGSLDANIAAESMVLNDFTAFLAAHPLIHSVYFNGATAERLFRRHVAPTLHVSGRSLRLQRLPSTSPAHAGLSFTDKLAAWSVLRDDHA